MIVGSCYIAVKNIMRKYGLPEPLDPLHCPQSKFAWKHRVNKHINGAPRGFGGLGRMTIYFQGAGEH